MRLFLAALALVLLAVVAAAVTRPGPEAFDAMLADAIRDRVANTDIGENSGDALDSVALAACKLRPSDCIRLVRQAIDVRMDERVLYTVADVHGFGRDARCWGAFGRFWCSTDLGRD
ncbi:MAG: hypothetical protein N2422_02925 [Rhodobacteraceae bacterium]|nr:hypothetical protein [Paracoccaceae bacterium]